jgi:4-hydroxy-tetrahydrodipicolinate synthase
LAFLAQGGDGCISVTSNVAPRLCRDMHLAVRCGQIGQAQQLASILVELTLALFSGPNPVPVKFALSLLGIMLPRVRLPLVELDEHAKPILAAALNNVKVHCPCDIVGDRAAGSSLVGVDGRNQSSSDARFTFKAIGNSTPAPATSSADLP